VGLRGQRISGALEPFPLFVNRGDSREAIEAAGATLLYLPPYSPDFNPIEQLFAKLKALLRKAGERSVEGLWNRIADLLKAFTPSTPDKKALPLERACGRANSTSRRPRCSEDRDLGAPDLQARLMRWKGLPEARLCGWWGTARRWASAGDPVSCL
jgi:hypothetical protein